MPVDYRFDPFQNILNPVTITGEAHTIPSVSPFTVRLGEVPLKNTPSSISLTIDGVRAEEVSSAPAAGQFWPDYSTGADGDDDWNTGTILFNAADAGKDVVVTYEGTGTVVWADLVNTHVFTESGEITAPSWATRAIISGCGGGGGGGNTYDIAGYGTDGGATSFGDLLVLGGGGGSGRGKTPIHGLDGSGFSALVRPTTATGTRGAGGGGPFGVGGTDSSTTGPGVPGTGYGSGGSGGLASSATAGIGGAAGGACVNKAISVVGGTTYTVTIGAGGKGGGSGSRYGGNGAPGILLIRWIRS